MLEAIPAEVSSIARAAVALLFLAAAAAKLVRPAATSAALGVLRIPDRYRVTVTRLLALVEVAVAASLLLVDSPAALVAPAVMLLVFSVFLGHLAHRGSSVACGCLGDLGSESHWLGLSRNLCLLALLALAAGGETARTTAWSVLGGAQVAVLLIVGTEGIYVIRRLHVQEMAYRD